jgi:hypothetical protein
MKFWQKFSPPDTQNPHFAPHYSKMEENKEYVKNILVVNFIAYKYYLKCEKGLYKHSTYPYPTLPHIILTWLIIRTI